MLWSNFKYVASQLAIGLGCTAIGAGFTSAYTHTSQSMKSCASAIEPTVFSAEKLLVEGDLDGAERYSGDALIMAPHDECATVVAAEVQAHRMVRARQSGNYPAAESARRLCYGYSIDQTSWAGASPRRRALSMLCGASSGNSVAVKAGLVGLPHHRKRHRHSRRMTGRPAGAPSVAELSVAPTPALPFEATR